MVTVESNFISVSFRNAHSIFFPVLYLVESSVHFSERSSVRLSFASVVPAIIVRRKPRIRMRPERNPLCIASVCLLRPAASLRTASFRARRVYTRPAANDFYHLSVRRVARDDNEVLAETKTETHCEQMQRTDTCRSPDKNIRAGHSQMFPTLRVTETSGSSVRAARRRPS